MNDISDLDRFVGAFVFLTLLTMLWVVWLWR